MDNNSTNKNHDEISNEINEQKNIIHLSENDTQNNDVDIVDSNIVNQQVDNIDISKNDSKEKKNWLYQLWHGNELLIIMSLGLLLMFISIFSDYKQKHAEINKESERLDKEKAQYVSDKKLPSEYWCTLEKKLCFLPASYKWMNTQYKQSFYQFINQHFPGEASAIDNYLNIRDNPEKYSSNNERINYIYLIIKHKSLVNIDEAIQRMDELNEVILKEKINSELEQDKSVNPSTMNKTLTSDHTNLMPQKDNTLGNISAEPIIDQPPVTNNVIEEIPEPNVELPQPAQQQQPQSTISITKIR